MSLFIFVVFVYRVGTVAGPVVYEYGDGQRCPHQHERQLIPCLLSTGVYPIQTGTPYTHVYGPLHLTVYHTHVYGSFHLTVCTTHMCMDHSI